MSKLYADRDAYELGQFYLRHVEAMSAEGLHSKADIAAELGFRDMRIAELERELAAAKNARQAAIAECATALRVVPCHWTPEECAKAIERLSTLPPTHVVGPVETLQECRNLLVIGMYDSEATRQRMHKTVHAIDVIFAARKP